MPLGLEGILQNVSKIKLKGGVVGKVSVILIVASLAMAAIAWSARVPWISITALAFVFALCFAGVWRLISFADKNPQAALLEGAEFLVHEQMRLGMKAEPVLLIEEGDREQPAPTLIEPTDPTVVQPDEPDSSEDAP